MPTAPTAITQSGITTLGATSPSSAVWTIAASGPTALATSLAPWAKDRSAAEKISGRPKSFLSDWLRFSRPRDWRAMTGLATSQPSTAAPRPISKAALIGILTSALTPLIDR
jgi:hypothetical protein